MCWRQVSKLQKTVCVFLFYFIVYLLFSYAITPEPLVTFLSEELRIGDKYVTMYLMGVDSPVLSDAEGADVFTARRCGNCFITNNRGFLPVTEYDAVLVRGDRKMLSEVSAYMDPDKRYLMEASDKCVRDKLRGCMREPIITSFTSKDSYSLCSLCSKLLIEKSKSKTSIKR